MAILGPIGWAALQMLAGFGMKYIDRAPELAQKVYGIIKAVIDRGGDADQAFGVALSHVQMWELENRVPTDAEWAALDVRLYEASEKLHAAE